MGQWEITEKGGSVERFNAEPGEVWLNRLLEHFRSVVWINPLPEKHWSYTHSIQMIREIFEDRMVPMTLDGLERGMRQLTR